MPASTRRTIVHTGGAPFAVRSAAIERPHASAVTGIHAIGSAYCSDTIMATAAMHDPMRSASTSNARFSGPGFGHSTFDSHAVATAHNLSLIHISEPTRQAEISYAVFCLKK